jgi:hypothetical protein
MNDDLILNPDGDCATKDQRFHGWLEPADARHWLYCCKLGERLPPRSSYPINNDQVGYGCSFLNTNVSWRLPLGLQASARR